MLEVRFMSLSGKFTTVKTERFATIAEASNAIEAYAAAAGFTHVKLVDGPEDELRFTARTPGGRGGRNVAFVDELHPLDVEEGL